MRRAAVDGVAAVGVAVIAVSLVVYALRSGALCWGASPTGPATLDAGPVTIGTDHSVYAPNDDIAARVVNQLSQPIWLVPPLDFSRGACATSVFQERSGQWQPLNCSHINARALYRYWLKVSPGGPYPYFGGRPVDWLPPATAEGAYRFAARYVLNQPPSFTFESGGDVAQALQGAPTVTSLPVHVCNCDRCPA